MQETPISPTAPPKEESPLPEGWVKFDSATHNRPFYYHKATKKTLWKRPEAPVEQERPLSPPASPDVVPSLAIEQKAEEPVVKGSEPEPVEPVKPKTEPVVNQAEAVVNQVEAVERKIEQVDRKVPTGPSAGAATDLVASAYAARRAKVDEGPRSAAPKGPSSARRDTGDSYRPRHSRSPSPRNEQAKRFKSGEGRRSPPFSARYPPNDRSTFSAFIGETSSALCEQPCLLVVGMEFHRRSRRIPRRVNARSDDGVCALGCCSRERRDSGHQLTFGSLRRPQQAHVVHRDISLHKLLAVRLG